MAAPLCREPATIIISNLDPEEAYIDMTLDLLHSFGIDSASEKVGTMQTVSIPAPQPFKPVDMDIEADGNTAMYFLALAALTGGETTVSNLKPDSRQPAMKFLDILSRLGCRVEKSADGVTVAGTGLPFTGGFSLDMRAMAEMALAMGVLALFADEPITMTNLGHIRNHETDRLSAISELLTQVGATTEVGEDWVRVHPLPRDQIKNVTIDSRGDHRVVMAFSLLGLAGNGITITNADSVAKTFPHFFQKLRDIGAEIIAK